MDNIRYIEARTERADSSCYRFEKLEFNSSLLDIDATYVIHLENNGRIDSVKSQLNKFQPTKLVYILYNKGYKKCDKDAYINKPPLDLVDAFLYIFKDAYEKNYKHVLILEDDFIFNEKIKNKMVQQHIMNFINNKNYDVYALGILPFAQKAYDNNTSICLRGMGTHAMIYSRNCIKKTLQLEKSKLPINKYKLHDWDFYIQKTFRKYIYNEPLCCQLFPKTENQESWPKYFGLKNLFLYIIKMLKLDVQVEPGYTFFYNISRILYGLSVILCVWLFVTIFKV